MDETDIGHRLRRWRRRRGLTQPALADLAGFTQGYIARIELGRRSFR
jgi:transcriptional regulator with XRE-family HTH domain